MREAKGIIVAFGKVIKIYVMTVTEEPVRVKKGRRWVSEMQVSYYVHGLTEDDDFHSIAHNFAHYILDGEYLENTTDKAVYKLWRIECL